MRCRINNTLKYLTKRLSRLLIVCTITLSLAGIISIPAYVGEASAMTHSATTMSAKAIYNIGPIQRTDAYIFGLILGAIGALLSAFISAIGSIIQTVIQLISTLFSSISSSSLGSTVGSLLTSAIGGGGGGGSGGSGGHNNANQEVLPAPTDSGGLSGPTRPEQSTYRAAGENIEKKNNFFSNLANGNNKLLGGLVKTGLGYAASQSDNKYLQTIGTALGASGVNDILTSGNQQNQNNGFFPTTAVGGGINGGQQYVVGQDGQLTPTNTGNNVFSTTGNVIAAGTTGGGATLTGGENSTFVRPTAGPLTSGFGTRFNGRDFHEGLDYDGQIGDPIVSTQAGNVIYSGQIGGFGNTVLVHHPNSNTVSLYGHNNQNLVRVGQQVGAGQQIATIGNTGHTIPGPNGDGSHLDFRVFALNNQGQVVAVDPAQIRNGTAVNQATNTVYGGHLPGVRDALGLASAFAGG